MKSFFGNPWVITIFGGAVATVLAFFIKKIFIKKKEFSSPSVKSFYSKKYKNSLDGDDGMILNAESTSGDNYLNVNIHNRSSKEKDKNNINIEDLKKIINILFVDDDTDFNIVKILKKHGWINTKIVTDVIDFDKYKNVHIFFIDINGVGVKLDLEHGGMDLALYLKRKYIDKKIVIYSSDTSRDMSHPVFREVDGILPKNAQIYEFTNYIDKFAREIKL